MHYRTCAYLLAGLRNTCVFHQIRCASCIVPCCCVAHHRLQALVSATGRKESSITSDYETSGDLAPAASSRGIHQHCCLCVLPFAANCRRWRLPQAARSPPSSLTIKSDYETSGDLAPAASSLGIHQHCCLFVVSFAATACRRWRLPLAARSPASSLTMRPVGTLAPWRPAAGVPSARCSRPRR